MSGLLREVTIRCPGALGVDLAISDPHPDPGMPIRASATAGDRLLVEGQSLENVDRFGLQRGLNVKWPQLYIRGLR